MLMTVTYRIMKYVVSLKERKRPGLFTIVSSITVMDKNQRILLVDDVHKNIQLIGTLLKEKGYALSIATNGKQALKIVEQTDPDLILLDVMMPEMDGMETCAHLKKNPRTANIPVIFLSALSDTVNKVKGFELGAVDYVTKPIEAKEMLSRVTLT